MPLAVNQPMINDSKIYSFNSSALSACSAVKRFSHMESIASTSAPVATIAEIGKHEGQTVTIRGWLYNLRESGKLLFAIFRDGSGTIQGVVAKNAVPAEVFDSVKGLTQES